MSDGNNTDLKKFFKKFATFIVVLIILDFLVGGVFKHYYFKQRSGLFYRTTYIINSTRADILVFGSSRAFHHYIPSVFENKLHTTFYNCGRDGYSLIYYAALISAVSERYSPKRIIIDLNQDELGVVEESKLSALLPYRNNPAIRPFLKYNGKFENYKLLSKTYPYNSLLNNIIAGNLSSNKSRTANDNGYVKLTRVMPFHQKTQFQQKEIISNRIKILDDILSKLSEKNIPVTLVVSPSYYSFAKADPVIAVYEKLYHKYKNVSFINYENDPAFAESKLFYNENHLNDIGAYKFSEDLADKLISNK